MSRQPYHINQASSLYSDLITVLRTLASNNDKGDSQQVMLRQESDGGRWILTAHGKEFKDLSLNRVIERAGRELTTVFDR